VSYYLVQRFINPYTHVRQAATASGAHKAVGAGVSEARVMFGPGYRVYFGRDGRSVIVLLVGGDKASQARDIENAYTYWKDYQETHRG
jgi:putative addiction module killer protein